MDSADHLASVHRRAEFVCVMPSGKTYKSRSPDSRLDGPRLDPDGTPVIPATQDLGQSRVKTVTQGAIAGGPPGAGHRSVGTASHERWSSRVNKRLPRLKRKNRWDHDSRLPKHECYFAVARDPDADKPASTKATVTPLPIESWVRVQAQASR